MVWEVICSWLILYISSSSLSYHSFSAKLSCPMQYRSRELRKDSTIQMSWFTHILPCIKKNPPWLKLHIWTQKGQRAHQIKMQPFSHFLKPFISSFSTLVSLHSVLKVCFLSHMTILNHKSKNTITSRDISRLFQQFV